MKKRLMILCLVGIHKLACSQAYLPLTAESGTPLSGTLYSDALQILHGNSAGTSNTYINLNNTGNASYFGIANSSGSIFTGSTGYSTNIGTDNNVKFHLATNGIVRQTIDGSGNVGIGTTTPGVKVDIAGGATGYGSLRLSSGDATKSSYLEFLEGSTQKAFIQYRNSGFTTPASTLEISGGGSNIIFSNVSNVGIGTTSPQYQLHLSTPNTADYYPLTLSSGVIGTTGNTVGMRFGFTGNTYQKAAFIYESADANGRGKMHVALDGNANSDNAVISDAKLTIDYYGNIGIGTTTPSEKLAVNGNIVAKEVKVTLTSDSWPDYVFHKNYSLRPLSEVEKFIKSNHQLPEIPSSKEVAENGIYIGEMNAKLLQKIEELTLYVIDLKKEIDLLKSK